MPIRPIKFISIDGTIKQAQGVISTTVGADNGPVESQLVTFSNIPTAGTWSLGIGSNIDDRVDLAYNDDAATIQTAMRAKANIASEWGSLLTVTGNYTIGFTITAAKYGNLLNLYTDREMGNLEYSSSMSGYASTESGWDNNNRATGAPDSIFAYNEIIAAGNSSTLTLNFNNVFTSMPAVKPTGYVIGILHNGNGAIKEITNGISFIVFGVGTAQFGDASNIWGSYNTSIYGDSFGLSGLGGSNLDWDTAYNSAGGLVLNVAVNNYYTDYVTTVEIDSVILTLYYNAPVTITQSTITDG